MRHFIALSSLLAVMAPTHAADLSLSGQHLDPSQFKALVEDVGALVGYRGQIPAEALGSTGFDVGVSMSSSRLQNMGQYRHVVDSNSTRFYTSAVHVHKGLPLGFDIGGYFSQGLNTNVRHRGFELRYALLDGSTTTPAIGLRASTTQLTHVGNLDLNTQGLDMSISKGFFMLTPYAGVGLVRVKGKTEGLSETVNLSKVFVGVGLNLLALNVNVEYDKTGDVPAYSAKLGWRF